ncbi:NAD(P)-dependent dehydrogenase, short-chain alcohol dehydrogenase family [Lutimaribacter pacificus]|uniref:NAD(P)-dependent dehydrogenase, short-chain alcohol dehydrogenase family n=1 Tax=Lutimaribacter pacificus TaxID=391948 RepID=A0A1H0CIS8_9RHOB|nr:SDR family oxidoreductase [Lutimaribacter pacificus]SDN57753.1 NAD(P)-dependent dehydrogenase, short-chain alcohol dehydrogenase family [Lutimaribacter pacificus]SHJ44136.1 NAD(P)-dependent dehydrogenase, short-chain alcohol dehydrogenase family [Lutimaribacter pacificus]
MTRALVTGAGKRLGRAMALYLAQRGHDVAVHYASSAGAAEEVAQAVRDMGRSAVTLQADLLDEDATQALLPAAEQALGGPVTCLVNNASIFEYDTIATATRDSWDRHMESNLRAPFILTQAMARTIPDPVPDGMGEPVAQGLVVNMIDQRVRKLTPEFMSYTIAKMGLWAFTQTAAQALAPRIRVNAIGPGPTLRGSRQSVDHFARQRAATVLNRGANPADITGALGFFLDSPGITGQLICVDGGQHLAWQTPDILGPE